MNITDKDLGIPLALVRSSLYGLLSGGFRLPNEALLNRIASTKWRDALSEVFDTHPGLAGQIASCARLQQSAEALAKKAGASAQDELNSEYARLFLVPGASQLQPYESMYTEGGSRLMGAAANSVLRRYQEDGLTLADEASELPDHFSLECEYVAHLARRQLGALAEDKFDEQLALDRRLEEFMQKHLGMWAGRFAKDVQAQAATAFYKDLGRLAEELIQWDAARAQPGKQPSNGSTAS